MNKYIVFLRGINVGGHRKILMKDLKELLHDNGFKNVITYIQSGNIVLESKLENQKICSKIKELIKETYGFDVPAIAENPQVLKKQIRHCPYLNKEDLKKVYFSILNEPPTKENWTALLSSDFGSGDISLFENMVYLYCPEGYGKTRLSNNYIEQKTGCIATTRNLKTMYKLIELAKN